jgi:uncharacterized protein with von Willebrand factor type A (vWA) domain
MARSPQTLSPAFSRPCEELSPIVVLLDVSGSMDRYARLFLHHAHSLMQRRPHVHVLTFSTRLNDITRNLQRDPDVALQVADAKVSDWTGGTRIASSLDAFTPRYAHRMLNGNACVPLVTDRLDRDDGGSRGCAAWRTAWSGSTRCCASTVSN